MSNVKVEQRSVTINGRRVDFEADINDVVELPTRTLVSVETYDIDEDDPHRGRNVFAFDDKGELLWRIADSGYMLTGSRGQDMPTGYIGIDKAKDGGVWVYDRFGFRMDLDPETGEMSNRVQVDK